MCREVSPAGPATNEGQNDHSIIVPFLGSMASPKEKVLDYRSLVQRSLTYGPQAIGGVVGC